VSIVNQKTANNVSWGFCELQNFNQCSHTNLYNIRQPLLISRRVRPVWGDVGDFFTFIEFFRCFWWRRFKIFTSNRTFEMKDRKIYVLGRLGKRGLRSLATQFIWVIVWCVWLHYCFTVSRLNIKQEKRLQTALPRYIYLYILPKNPQIQPAPKQKTRLYWKMNSSYF